MQRKAWNDIAGAEEIRLDTERTWQRPIWQRKQRCVIQRRIRPTGHARHLFESIANPQQRTDASKQFGEVGRIAGLVWAEPVSIEPIFRGV